MKKNIVSVLLLASVLLISGCPYMSSVPITPESMAINPDLLGKWSDSKYGKNYTMIEKASNTAYKITSFTYNSSKKNYSQKVYRAFFSEVGGKIYLNVESAKNKYLLYRFISVTKTNYYIEPVTDNIKERFTSSQTLKEFIEKHQHLSFFVEKKMTFYKKK